MGASHSIKALSPDTPEFELVRNKLRDATISFMDEYCEHGLGFHVSVQEFYSALRSFMSTIGLARELALFEKFKQISLDDLRVPLTIYSHPHMYLDGDKQFSVIVHIRLKSWPLKHDTIKN
jgi:hypothetical protein